MDFEQDPPDEEAIVERIAALANDIHSEDLERRRAVVQEIYDICYKVPALAKSAVPVLVECLADPDHKVGESALWGLHYCVPESIEPLVQCLAHGDAQVRERASHSLGNIGDEAIVAAGELRRLLDDPVQDVRTRAAWSLGLIHDTSERTVARLFRMAESSHAKERDSALHALGNIGKALVDPKPLRLRQRQILAALTDEDHNVRWSAWYVLQSLDLEPSRHAQLVIDHLEADPSSRVREALVGQLKSLVATTEFAPYLPSMCRIVANGGTEARNMCEVLAVMGPRAQAAVPCLLEALKGEDFLVIEAAKALWKIERRAGESLPALARVFDDNPEAVCDVICEIGPAAAPLVPKVMDALQSREYWDLEWAAADALGHVASEDPAVVAVLASALGHPSPVVRSAAAGALARTGLPALPALQAIMLDTSDERCEWAADALGRMGHLAAPAADSLRKARLSEKRAIAVWSSIALAKVTGDPSLVPTLIDLLREERADLRHQAAIALKAVGPPAISATAALRPLLEDEDPEVRQAAEEALAAISSSAH